MQYNLFDDSLNKVLSTKSYEEFKEKLIESNCERCVLSKNRRKIVVDRGNPASKIMAIGEAPGENEDRQGLAFVGRAGRLLDDMMDELGIDTNKILLITNIVKCKPPGNRVPRSEEADACHPFLNKQMEFIKPRIILLLGATALKFFIPEKKDFSMEGEVGKFFDHPSFPGVRLMVLYHPAYILRNPSKKEEMRSHLLRFREALTEVS